MLSEDPPQAFQGSTSLVPYGTSPGTLPSSSGNPELLPRADLGIEENKRVGRKVETTRDSATGHRIRTECVGVLQTSHPGSDRAQTQPSPQPAAGNKKKAERCPQRPHTHAIPCQS